MNQLARIEIQLIMNYLTRVELTQFSRCSRRLFSDGDTDLAWRTQPLYELPNSSITIHEWVSLTASHSTTTGAPLFMRHNPKFSLTLNRDFLIQHDGLVQTLTRLFGSISTGLVRFKCQHLFSGEGSEWWPIFQQTQFEHLREVHFDCNSMGVRLSHVLVDLQRFSNLQSLQLPCAMGMDDWESDSAVGLQTFPELTSLTFYDAKLQLAEDDPSISTVIMKCERLTQLRINELLLNATEFNHVFASPHLGRLKDLTITRWTWLDIWMDKQQAQICTELLCSTWQSLASLERLTLISVADMTRLVGTLKSCGPNFKLLSITTSDRTSSYYPSSFSLHELLTTHPQLSIQLTVDADEKDGTEEGGEEAHPSYSYLDESMKARFKLILV